MLVTESFDFIVIGAGSAGCAVAYQLSKAEAGTVAVLEAGPSNAHPLIRVPFGLSFIRGTKRDWGFTTSPQSALKGREVHVTRGRTLGGSSSVNSMVWFRGRRNDFDNWNMPGWSWTDVEPAFEAVEALLTPERFPEPHPLSEAYGRALGDNGMAPPNPERESAGVFHVNMRNGARWSAADAFLKPAIATGRVNVLTGANVDRIEFEDGIAKRVVLIDGRVLRARHGVILSAGSIGSPAILMRSGIGPSAHLADHGIATLQDVAGVGANLHDHPAVGLHFAGNGSGYGLALDQLPRWAAAPFNWLLRRRGRLVSNVVEAGAFFRAMPVGPDGDDRPDCQSHFIPFMMGYKGRQITWGSGYFADTNICRPFSRGRLTLASKDPHIAPHIDSALLSDERDVQTLINAVRRLRDILQRAPFEDRRGVEVFPGESVQSDDELEDFVRQRSATSYHPVGTARMGTDDAAPVSERLQVRGVDGLWVADASVMPSITTANTNAPSMMIGYRAGAMIAEDVRK